MTNTLVILLPLLPGKQEAWRQFCQILQGSRRSEYDAWCQQMGITRQEVWLSQTVQGDLVRIHLQEERLQHALTDLMLSRRPFDRWLWQQLLELHGLDMMQLVSASVHELIFIRQPAPLQEATLDEE